MMLNPVPYLAGLANSSEPAILLLITLFVSYPLGIIYRRWFHGRDPTLQHIFFWTVGLCLVIMNYGTDVWHSMVDVTICYLLCRYLGGTVLSVVLAFLCFMGHLLLGYLLTATEGYDILWTLPQCILTLRLIGLVFDVYDGQKDPSELEKEQVATAVREAPTFLETCGYSYFFGSFLVGPQFPMTRYRQFVQGGFGDPDGGAPESIKACLARLVPGLLFLTAHQLGNVYFSTEYLVMADFRNMPFLMRILFVGAWYRNIIFRYQAVWLITEGSCILSGIAHNGMDDQGRPMWDGVKNIHNRHFELAILFKHIAESFNYNTNLWVRSYVFKRLKFMGNKELSQFSALMFIAAWHGLFSGYFVCFAYEFLCFYSERHVIAALDRLPGVRRTIDTPAVYPATWLVQKLWIHFHCTFGLLPFVLLSYRRWSQVYSDVYWFGVVLMALAIGGSMTICSVIRKPRKVERGVDHVKPDQEEGELGSANDLPEIAQQLDEAKKEL